MYDFVSRDLASAITNWTRQNWQGLQNDYPKQYVACGLGEVVAHGENFDLVLQAAQDSGRTFIMHWTLLPHPSLQVPSI
jgi:Family of unknown function (DUF5678)